MPWGARQIVIDEVSKDPSVRWEILSALAARANIVGFQIRGGNGVLVGSPRDIAIVKTYARTGAWAKRTVRLLERFFEGHRGLYVDVGANIGATVIPVSGNSNVRCIALEPDPENYQHLRLNILANCPHGNVEAKQVASYSVRSKLRFELSPVNMGDHRIRLTDASGEGGEELWREIEIEALPLDELLPPYDGLLALKIDTQGAEPFVVAGGRNSILRADLVIMEFSPYQMSRMRADVAGMLDFFRSSLDVMAIADGEEAEFGDLLPADAVCDRLAQLQPGLPPGRYVDLIFGRRVLEIAARLNLHRRA
jgi:FkbM family methyltransferase